MARGDKSRPGDWPGTDAVAVTPDDTAELADGPCRGVHVGVGGDMVVRFAGSTADVTLKVADNTFYPYSLKLIKSTNTTATNIVAIY